MDDAGPGRHGLFKPPLPPPCGGGGEGREREEVAGGRRRPWFVPPPSPRAWGGGGRGGGGFGEPLAVSNPPHPGPLPPQSRGERGRRKNRGRVFRPLSINL